ncbi:hypothetical protein BFJ70_g14615 [Fusarium oxysporum]|uniref:Uncharacterized protein n=2 Tax=Fusarium oxysporum TaxID=5507 RepID=A0A2H3HPY5_FUSOX|nr:hypothetical protein AU210_003581 [Fusarium oxysporum f. sp. radicis-cucumerinum]RKK18728.1 hypothetical protein BFJ65_g9025 [Fusarium oxysporum f. sp. cepae]RKK46454.1 hypothetical protein BFJ66_g8549 [Fusarium oxysporum f. sp. cepae]RKK49020.1 hypothetical protein BFJ67_g7070 [Fusarium oxysporum f. sp. cepae]RKL17434.1 hypothetical protein BFJ70_g14615 [Fusarium oxysporum]
MASSSTISTPPLSNDLPRLLLEIWIQIFEGLESLGNFQSLISASPIAFGYFQGGKSHILRLFVDNINNHIDNDIIALLLSSFRVRKLLHKTPGLTLSQIGDEISAFLNPLFRPDTPNPFQEWDRNLSAVVKVTISFRKIDSAIWFYKAIRGRVWFMDHMSSVPFPSQPEASKSELKKFLVTFMHHTILLDLSTYREGTLFNPRTSILDSVAWQAANPNLEDIVPKLWQRSSNQAGALVISDRGLAHVAVNIAIDLHGRSEDGDGGYTQVTPLLSTLPLVASEEPQSKYPGVSSVSPSPTLMSYLSARLNGGVR